MKKIKCNSCFHKDACYAWIRHGSTLYDNYDYSVENCPYYVLETDVKKVIHANWELHKDGSGTCDYCRTTSRAVYDDDNWQDYCGHCGAIMDLEWE